MADVYGLKLAYAKSSAYVHVWQETADPDDLVLPDAEYLPFPSVDGLEPPEARAEIDGYIAGAMARRYPAKGGAPRVTVTRGMSRGRSDVYGWAVRAHTLPVRVPSRRHDEEEILAAALAGAEGGNTEPFLVQVASPASRRLRELYRLEGYRTAPVTIKAVDGDALLVTPNPVAAKVRLGRAAGARRRADAKEAELAKRRAAERAESDTRARARRYHEPACAAVKALLEANPRVAAAGSWRSYAFYAPQVPDGPRNDRSRSWLCALRAAVWLYQRLVAKGPGWQDLSAVRAAAQAFRESGDLVGHPQYDVIHPGDLDDVAWFKAQVGRILKRAAAPGIDKTRGKGK